MPEVRTRRIAILGALIGVAALIAALLAIVGRTEALPIGGSPPRSASPSRSPDHRVGLIRYTCALRPSSTEAAASVRTLEECTGSVRNVGEGRIPSLDVWVDALDERGRPTFSCRARVADDFPPGSELTWRTVCDVQPAATHRVRFTDREGMVVPTPEASPSVR